MYDTERQRIVTELFQAYFDARRNKRNTINALAFEKDFERNIFDLADEILDNRYEIRPSICFIVNQPVKREIFAANFRDRVVHHFIYNYIYPLFDRLFINDSYSCRVGKGVHYGVKRLEHFFRSCSRNYTRDAWVLKLDIQGYFMAIRKPLLFKQVDETLHEVERWVDFNLELALRLIHQTIFNDPRVGCIIKGRKNDWNGLPPSKSLFHAPPDCGLPIGNLTSQLFANIYLNGFDHFVKRDLGMRYYGRYVDDFVLIHHDKEYLLARIPRIREYLSDELFLTLHPNKVYLQHVSKGVKYLGTVIKPHRTYIAARTTGNFYAAIQAQNRIVRDHKPDNNEQAGFLSCINSYLGIMRHYKAYQIRKRFLLKHVSGLWWNLFKILGYTKLSPKTKPAKAKKGRRKPASCGPALKDSSKGQSERQKRIRRWYCHTTGPARGGRSTGLGPSGKLTLRLGHSPRAAASKPLAGSCPPASTCRFPSGTTSCVAHPDGRNNPGKNEL
jgi:retron-type reverse transcriptase